MRVLKLIIFLVLAIFLNYAESSSSSSRNNIPEPENGVLPSRFYYADGTIHERGRPNTLPVIQHGYFLGMEDNFNIYPIFNDNIYRVYSFRERRLVELTNDERFRLIQGRSLERPLRRRGGQSPQASTSSSFFEPDAFSGLPAQYFYAHGTIHENGRPTTLPLIVQNYFFGMVDYAGTIYPVDSSNPYHVYSLIARTMVRISPELRQYLLG